MKGYRTLLVGLAMAAVPPALSYLAGVDWTQYVSPNVATMIAGAVTVAMRLVTSTPVGGAK
jgi:hypothetical protein